MFLKGKRGQITIFILAGIAVLIGVSVFFFIRGSSFREQFEDVTQRIVTERISSEFRPVQEFIINCARDVARDGIVKVGRHGGYVDSSLLRADRFNPTSATANSIYYWPGTEDYKVAYWWHMTSPDSCVSTNSCTFSSNKPDLEASMISIEGFLEEYIESEIHTCFDGFRSLRRNGFEIEERGPPVVDVTIATSDVFVEVRMPITAGLDGRAQDLSIYNTLLDVNLREIYNIASLIADYQANNAFLELQLIELIALYSGTGRDSLLPPVFDPAVSQFETDRRHIWTRTEIKSSLMSILASYIPLFSVYESLNFNVVSSNSPIDRAVFDLAWIFLNTTKHGLPEYLEYDVNFYYRSWWDMHVKIGASETLSPTNMEVPIIGQFPLIGSGINRLMPLSYQFGYDVSYPVLVTIRSPDAFNNQGFIFNFALESNVRNTIPVSPSIVTADFTQSVGGSLFRSMFCSKENFKSGDISVRVVDADTNEPLEGVSIDYHCAVESCMMGSTRNTGSDTILESKFPICPGGFIEASLLGYESVSIPLSTELDVGFEIPDIRLEKIREKDIQVKVLARIKSPSGTWSLDQGYKNLRDGESVVLIFNKIKTNNYDPDFSTVAFIDSSTSVVPIDIVPGEYEVIGQLILDTSQNDNLNEVTIAAASETICPCIRIAGICMCSTETIDFPDIPFGEIFPQGSLYLDNNHGGTWIVSAEDLDSTDLITFYIMASPYITEGIELKHSDLDQFGRSDFYSREYRSDLEPCFDTDEVCSQWV